MPIQTIGSAAEALLKEERAVSYFEDEAFGSLTLRRRSRSPKKKRKALKSQSLLQWSMKVPEPKVGMLDFEAFPFQPEIYEVLGGGYRDVVIRKGTQVGASSMMVRWAIREADVNGRTVMYVFPTAGDVYDWGDIRITPLFEEGYLSTRMGEPFNKGLKRIGGGYVFFRGSESKRKLDSVDADALAFDEYDTLNQRNIPDAERRLSGPLSAGLIRRIGVPSLPEFGIAEQYDASDMRKWLVRCENAKCKDWNGRLREKGDIPLLTPDERGGWQEIDFWRNVVWEERLDGKIIENVRRVCEHCRQPLDVSKGTWVAQQPESNTPGFHISRLLAPGAHLEDVVKASKKTTPYEIEVFFNKDLGLPYVNAAARLSVQMVKACQRDFELVDGYYGGNPVTMGVDVASERALNVRISEHIDQDTKRALWIGEVEDDDDEEDGMLAFDKLALLMDAYQVKMCVIDAMPESRMARKLARRYPGRVYLCRYAESGQVLTVNEDIGEVSVRRTEAIDATNDMIRQQTNLLPKTLPIDYIGQMCANVRKVERDEFDKVKVYWEATRPNDYSMAEVYDLVATEMFWLRTEVDYQTRDEEKPLDEYIEFKRSQVNNPNANDISLGPEEPHERQRDSMYGDEMGGDSMYESY